MTHYDFSPPADCMPPLEECDSLSSAATPDQPIPKTDSAPSAHRRTVVLAAPPPPKRRITPVNDSSFRHFSELPPLKRPLPPSGPPAKRCSNPVLSGSQPQLAIEGDGDGQSSSHTRRSPPSAFCAAPDRRQSSAVEALPIPSPAEDEADLLEDDEIDLLEDDEASSNSASAPDVPSSPPPLADVDPPAGDPPHCSPNSLRISLRTSVPPQPPTAPPTAPECPVAADCAAFLPILGIEEYLDPTSDLCFCGRCYPADLPDVVEAGGARHPVPRGWRRFSLKVETRAAVLRVATEWHVAFHGLPVPQVRPLLNHGMVLLPGDKTLDRSRPVRVRRGHAPYKPFFFSSPSIKCAAQTTYATRLPWTSPSSRVRYDAQVCLEVRQQPGSYQTQAESATPQREVDPHVPNHRIEWFTDSRAAVVFTAVLIRLSRPA